MEKKELDYEKVLDTMVTEMKLYIKKSNIKSGILGISGGIDSALVAALLYETSLSLSKEDYAFSVVGRSLPTLTTDKEEYKTSLLVGEAFCGDFKAADPRFIETNAKNIYDGIVEGEAQDTTVMKESVEHLRLGNIKSRLRMVFLYDLAKVKSGIVFGTDNYTEYLLGFSTIGGDGLFDYCPIQYLWKTEVFGFSKWLMKKYADEEKYDLAFAIKRSLSLKPMDGLGISSSDMDQIGAKDYYETDSILQSFIAGETELPGVSSDVWQAVVRRHQVNSYKSKLPIRIPRENYDK